MKHTLASFYSHHGAAIWPDAHLKNVDSNQRNVERLIGGATPLTKITTKRLAEMVSQLQREGKKPSTINTRLSHFKGLLSYAVTLEELEALPGIPWAKRKDNSRMKFLSHEEENALIVHAQEGGTYRLGAILAFLIDTGLRPSELLISETASQSLTWDDVSEDAGGHLPSMELGPYVTIQNGKTEGYRTVPLTLRAKEALLEEVGRKQPFHNYSVDFMSRVVASANMKDVVLYTMRHTCASRLVQRGADLRRIRDWMGHKDIKTTMRYAKLAPKDVFEIKELLE